MSNAGSNEYTSVYQELLMRMLKVQKELRVTRMKRVLTALAAMKNKSRYVRTLEEKLSAEIQTHNRQDKVDTLLEMLECDNDVSNCLHK